MISLGYAHALYSFELVRDSANLPPEVAHHGVRVPEGLLIVRRELLREAAKVSSLACYRAVHRGLARHGPWAQALARCGLDDEWAGHMRHWGERLMMEDENRARRIHQAALLTPRRQELLDEAAGLWQRLDLAVRLSGLNGAIPLGRRPRAGLALAERLLQIAGQIDQAPHAGRLAQFGFGAAERARLRELAAAIPPARQALAAHRAECRALGGPIVCIRGALLGDLARLCQAAQALLPSLLSAPLRMCRLVP